MSSLDVVAIGAGHNGLIAATYLAKAGLKTLIVEQRDCVGGVSSSIESFPGFKYHPFHTGRVDSLRPEIICDLGLSTFGFEPIELEPRYTVIFPHGEHLSIHSNPTSTAQEIARFSINDAAAVRELGSYWKELAKLIPNELKAPPSFAEFIASASASPQAAEMLRTVFFGTVDKFLRQHFESELVQAALVVAAQLGAEHGPSAQCVGTFPLLFCSTDPWKVALGGLGRIAEVLQASATASGVEFLFGRKVEEILIEGGQCRGVRLSNKKIIESTAVVSGLAARTTFLDMIAAGRLDCSFCRRVARINYQPGGISLSLALRELPQLPMPRTNYRGCFAICPSLDYAEEAFHSCTMREMPKSPLLFGIVPSFFDSSLAPPGCHVMHLYAHPFPYELRSGNWLDRKREAIDKVIEALAEQVPNLRTSILDVQAFTPCEAEQLLSLPRGDAGHGVCSWDQQWFFRPPYGRTDFRTPIPNLYLCGPDIFPGHNTTSGASGYNAAHAVIEDRNRCE